MLKKTAIRQLFTDLLKTNLTICDGRVFAGRILPYGDKESFPATSIYTRNEIIEEYFTDHTFRSLDLVVVIAIKENDNDNLNDGDFDEKIEDAQEKVEELMTKILSSNNLPNDPFKLFEELQYRSNSISANTEGNDNIGFATLTYTIAYRYQNPINVGELEDFDEIGSARAIDIINLRPLS